MILYHGTIMVIPEPQVLRSEYGRDFGFAFYTTDIKPQAERWARRKAMIENRKPGIACKPIVNVYEWNNEADINMLRFEGASLEWLDLVVRCRNDISFTHGYDIVEGKIANDNVGETVSFVMQGIMRREDAVQRLQFEKINNQIAFCTDRALRTLRFVDSYVVGE